MHQHTAKISAALLMVCVAGANSIFDQAFAKPPVKKAQARTAHSAPTASGSAATASDGTVVTKNADGSVEVTDGGGSAAGAVESGGGAVTTGSQKVVARQVRTGNTHYTDGVTVKRNSDGSVEVSDPPTIERWGSQAAPATTTHRSTAPKKRKHK